MRRPIIAARVVCALLALSGATGCTASVHEYHAAGYAPAPRSAASVTATPIEAEGRRTVILWFGGSTDYVDDAYRQLVEQCPGEIIAVNTRTSSSLRFLSYEDVVHVRALCVR